MANKQCSTTLTTTLGFVFLSINSALAVYRSWGDPVSMAFVAVAYAALLLLFYCLRWFERAGQGGGDGAGGRRNSAGAQYSALAAVGVAAVMCRTALDAHSARRDDLASAALLVLSYTNLVGMTGLFLGTVARR